MFEHKWKFCANCGAKLESGWNYCSECGAKIGDVQAQPEVIPHYPLSPLYPPMYPSAPRWPYPWEITFTGTPPMPGDVPSTTTGGAPLQTIC